MSQYAIITENDLSKWSDKTGSLYHFPNKYKKILTTGTNIIYYKGKITDKKFKDSRLMDEPHYFGSGIIGGVYKDKENSKNFYAEIKNYTPFTTGIYFKKNDNTYYEHVLTSNHWRNGVRAIDASIYNEILSTANISSAIDIKSTQEDIQIKITEGSLIKHKSNDKISTYNSFTDIKEIGDRGEKIVLEYLKEILDPKENETLRWLANENETPGYDIEYINLKKEKVCIEVKSTTAKKFPYFHLTINEKNALENNQLYYIYLVSDCNSKNPKIEILDNHCIKTNLKLEAIAFKVYRL